MLLPRTNVLQVTEKHRSKTRLHADKEKTAEKLEDGAKNEPVDSVVCRVCTNN